MARYRTHSTEFKREVVQDYLAGETLHSLARRHDLACNLIRIWAFYPVRLASLKAEGRYETGEGGGVLALVKRTRLFRSQSMECLLTVEESGVPTTEVCSSRQSCHSRRARRMTAMGRVRSLAEQNAIVG